jgi:hypothetical protein
MRVAHRSGDACRGWNYGNILMRTGRSQVSVPARQVEPISGSVPRPKIKEGFPDRGASRRAQASRTREVSHQLTRPEAAREAARGAVVETAIEAVLEAAVEMAVEVGAEAAVEVAVEVAG